MSAHTPGPWFIVERSDTHAYVGCGESDLIARVGAPGERNGVEAFANARLIALAPVMKMRLESAQRQLDGAAELLRADTDAPAVDAVEVLTNAALEIRALLRDIDT